MKYNKNGSFVVELSIVVVVIGLLAAIFIPAAKRMRDRNYDRYFEQNTYQTWVKLTGRTDFTYEEWVAARKAGLITVPVVNYSNNNKAKIENEQQGN